MGLVSTGRTHNWFLGANDINVLEWPEKSLDLNIIEDVWGAVVRCVYKNGKHYDCVDDLQEAIAAAWVRISTDYLKKPYDYVSRRLLSIIKQKRCKKQLIEAGMF